jgi:hypothetical protein
VLTPPRPTAAAAARQNKFRRPLAPGLAVYSGRRITPAAHGALHVRGNAEGHPPRAGPRRLPKCRDNPIFPATSSYTHCKPTFLQFNDIP